MKISSGKIKTAQKVVIYGPEGVGKSTFASRFPKPIFIDTEGSTKKLDVTRFDRPTSWEMLLEQVEYIKNTCKDYKTLVVDTADWAEKLCIAQICARAKKSGIEDFGYGKGYVYIAEEFGKLLNLLEDVIDQGINVVITAHAKMNRVELPDEMGAYDRWELKLTKQSAPLLKEWADTLLFANYKTTVVNTGDKKYKGQGGSRRIMYTSHTACWDAKNRDGLPDTLPFSYAEIASSIEDSGDESAHIQYEQEQTVEKSVAKEKTDKKSDPLNELLDDLREKNIPVTDISTQDNKPNEIPEYVPKKLADLMRASNFTVEDIENAVTQRGYFPASATLKDYPMDFIEGCLIGAWDKIKEFILRNKDLPF